MKEQGICKRCHRLRVVNEVRYCAECNEILRALERPKRRAPTATPALDKEALAAANESLLTLSPEEKFAERLYEKGRERVEQEARARAILAPEPADKDKP